ncbi:hypothetical protein F4802DRAFT_616022 [Xylaria palmicola]|nr:hypothetical protein F4802DRAFT_616022 [Xylaria palmicola]
MRAFPQQPGPGGSRVIKRRPSYPSLGDGLLAAFTSNAALTKSTGYRETGIPTALTSSSLDELAKSTPSYDGLVSTGTPSTCSDDDVILIGTPSQSIKSKSSARSSSASSTPRGDESPPTTLAGDDSLFSSGGETALNSSATTPVNDKTFLSSKPTLSPAFAFRGTVISSLQSPVASSLLTEEVNIHDPHPIPSCYAERLPEPLASTPVYRNYEAILANEIVPDDESLYGIVRGFLATETIAKNITPSAKEPQQPPSPTIKAPHTSNTFWDPRRIFDFYLRGAITPEKAKETARRHGFPGVVTVLERAEVLQKLNPSLHLSDILTKAAKDGSLGILMQTTEILASTPPLVPCDTAYDKFMNKLATYSAEDGSAGSAKPLHIFVDMSNIHIGFCNSWKASQNIPIDRRVRAPAFNFKVLATIMERNRSAKKKVLASSVASHVVSRMQWPQHFVDAEKQGYKASILSRVQKVSPVKIGRRRKTSTQGPSLVHPNITMTSSDESAEDLVAAGYQTRNGEQGVDEILHLNMMNSILDDMQEPSSMILATGDAAQAEFSDGFLEYATRALSLGWDLELVTWKTTVSSAWMNPIFRSKYGERFRIIYLDGFLEELNADLCPSLA